jgi:hypothetical protein
VIGTSWAWFLPQPLDHPVHVGIGHHPHRPLDVQPIVAAGDHGGPHFHGRGIAQRLTGYRMFGDDLRLAHRVDLLIAQGLGIRLGDQAPEDVGTHLITEQTLQNGARRTTLTEAGTRALRRNWSYARSISAVTSPAGISTANRRRTASTVSRATFVIKVPIRLVTYASG